MAVNTTLALPTASALKNELALADPQALTVTAGEDQELEQTAEKFVAAVLAFDPNDPAQQNAREANIAAVETLGGKTQKEAAHRSAMLKQPIRSLASKSEDGGEVARSLVELNIQVEELDPGKFDFEAGWFARLLGWIPGIGTPLKRYFIKFEQSDTVIDAIVRSLKDGQAQLSRDNITLIQDQKAMRGFTFRLEKTIKLGMQIDQRLEYALEREVEPGDAKASFIQEELLFPLRQRIQDLQQQLAVNQQGVLAIELLVRNNKELIKGVDRAINVTVNMLSVAVTVALALANQKIVLEKIDAINKTTNRLIEENAARLKTQGAAIQKQAASTQLSMESLERAFADIHTALEDIATFRKEALPMMAENILGMERMTAEAEAQIQKQEQGNQAAPTIELDFTGPV
ncbi:MAG: toxic anion resistance protein [Candidatus Electrothrix aestuarii]|uniref:Toxic anion resistance protein n=1 Tax=Candidatus Electrothrix aestuarii TaxID=3062594 RepID=A0AAU8LT05_9BACT|nr:toxic anion resistance protein [Candidatus Electrothrix aestuarii]